jgi:Reverse transcriptase (RNA-dependent DNA polymerase)
VVTSTPRPQPPPSTQPSTSTSAAAAPGYQGTRTGGEDDRWQRQLHTWAGIAEKFGINPNRYSEFEYLLYLDVDNAYVRNYVNYHLELAEPIFIDRIKLHYSFWETLCTPAWLLDFIQNGVQVPFISPPPHIEKRNNKSVLLPENVVWVRDTLTEYITYGFIERVQYKPHCVMPLQIKDTATKRSLIFDMTKLNEFVQKAKFRLEGWETMFQYAVDANYAIKFDLKKFYHEISLHRDYITYFGFEYDLDGTGDKQYFVWKTLPYGYSRAPFIARQLLKPLIAKWRLLGALCVIFYDDGMCVAKCPYYLRKISLQIQCDLLRAGLVPGYKKCEWFPVQVIDWNGLRFDFLARGISILPLRVLKIHDNLNDMIENWPNVTYRDVSRCVGRIISLGPVLQGEVNIFTKMLQNFVNIRHYKNQMWDSVIAADFLPLFAEALFELRYWQECLDKNNFRPFVAPVSKYLAWTDAAEAAVAGVLVPAACLAVGREFSIDNWLPDRQNSDNAIMRTITVRDVYGHPEPAIITHKNLAENEKLFDSNERELIAVDYLIHNLPAQYNHCSVTLHTDSYNAATILSKGSNKTRLNVYARKILLHCKARHIILKCVWIPRDLNMFADSVSRFLDLDDHAITDIAFENICSALSCKPNIDLFANSKNTRLPKYFSLSYTTGCLGVNAFNYDWGNYTCCWAFPPIKLIEQSISYAKSCKANVLFVIPQWKHSSFYPVINALYNSIYYVNRVVYNGASVLEQGTDENSFFGPHFKGNIEVYHFNFNC